MLLRRYPTWPALDALTFTLMTGGKVSLSRSAWVILPVSTIAPSVWFQRPIARSLATAPSKGSYSSGPLMMPAR